MASEFQSDWLPSSLFITTTAIAPASWAFFTLTVKEQSPLSIKAIFPFTLESILWQPSEMDPPIPSEEFPSVDPSLASIKLFTIASFDKAGPNAALAYVYGP